MVTLSAGAQAVFFATVFGPEHEVTKQVKQLVAAGVVFEVGLYTIEAKFKDVPVQTVTLTYGTTSLMKGTGEPVVIAQNKKKIEDWVVKVYDLVSPYADMNPVPASGSTAVKLYGYLPAKKLVVIKAAMQMSGLGLADTKALVEKSAYDSVTVAVFSTYAEAIHAQGKLVAAGGMGVNLVPVIEDPVAPAKLVKPVTVKPVDAVISLRDAEALGQKVHGTSNGSVYYCIAISEQGVKVAARLHQGGSISIRAEWTGNPQDELDKLTAIGMQMKSSYASWHFDATGVPLARCVGAFLFDTGIAWKSMVKTGAELVIGGTV